MREILFRGQTRRKGERVRMDGTPVESNWVYGGVLQGKGDFSIIYGGTEEELKNGDINKYTVYSDTVGQYTGLTDKNGSRIFEGDVVRIGFIDGYEVGPIKWSGIAARYKFMSPDGSAYGLCAVDDIEVIGNIHDNPELLEEEPT